MTFVCNALLYLQYEPPQWNYYGWKAIFESDNLLDLLQMLMSTVILVRRVTQNFSDDIPINEKALAGTLQVVYLLINVFKWL